MQDQAPPQAVTTLQSLIWPEQGICTERDLYVRLSGPAGLSERRHELRFAVGGRALFDTWFNLFNIGKWRQQCGLRDLRLALEGEGRFELAVMLAFPHRSWERICNDVITLDPEAPFVLDLSPLLDLEAGQGVIFFELIALEEGRLSGAQWQTAEAPRRTPELMLSITTFRREAAVERTVRRFETYIAASPLRDHIRLTVVDNGQSVEIPESSHVTVIPNENLGGAGGFSRGLLAARDSGASHCLFMDDDASVHMESLDRTWRMLAYATDPATAVAGAMINASHRWAIWENGALFDSRCLPQHMGTDLRNTGQSFAMEFDTTGPAPDKLYGGWWYFAFPVDRVAHQPFPFFVRGDDVSFSLVHEFNIVRLNGVVSFQDSFTDKESPLTWYLDLRSHMAHHLSLPEMEIGALRTLKIAVWFFLRNLPRMHYETLAAINLALADVMKGPEFFDANADMAQRRADLKALTRQEAWTAAPGHLPEERIRRAPRGRLMRTLMKLTLNGHLLPFFSRWGGRIVLRAEDRGKVGWSWGAAEITYLSADRRQCYTVRHSKRAFLREAARFTALALAFLLRYPRLLTRYRKGYEQMTGEGYWRAKLRMEGAGAEGS
ncbi:glycosyltransferase family 2 protein [Antarcticimicrobium luteum]|uniref:Glycosyltransferase family 2 protein n=1 Tax=Antarcticimicrobium luteum TaxID=2547397 RepID=A0A4R5VF49_9RHOB|nr:glycosyltransferase [Antarcticimicrobium luteum]TDK50891.1 glycosyltransferase family 2 protein [Antarcticimicrobium luteum]